MKRWTLSVLVSIIVVIAALAQPRFTVKENLRSKWLSFNGQEYVKVEDANSTLNTIYLDIKLDEYQNDRLSILSNEEFFVFLNGKILGEYKTQALLSIDSLASLYSGNTLLFAIHHPVLNVRNLHTEIVSAESESASVSHIDIAKPSSSFRDFVTVGGLFLVVMFLVILRTNPKLAADYFSVTTMFSLREGDDSQSNARLTSSSNVQFYIFCSLLLGYYLLIVSKHLPEVYSLPSGYSFDKFSLILLQWLKLSFVIFIVFLCKIVIVFGLTRLFNMRGTARIHFFNWMRILLITASASAVVLFVYYILRGQSETVYVIFLWTIVITLAALVITGYFKLGNRSEHSMFHLFSYICATEIIPLLLIIKVLFQ